MKSKKKAKPVWKYSKDEKKFLGNWAIYLSLLKANKWNITNDVLKLPLDQWKDHYGKEAPPKIFGVLALILFPYVRSGASFNER